jgi:hypothetical protein
MRLAARIILAGAWLLLAAAAFAQDEAPKDAPTEGPLRDPLLDRMHQRVNDTVWRSAMMVDHLFGSQYEADVYQKGISGSIVPALMWDEFEGFKPRFRFKANLPLPQLNQRFNAFIGRVDRDEYVTERSQESGAFRRQYGPSRDEQTIFGISYRAPIKQGGRFDAGAGVRLRTPLDPYLKGGYIYQRGAVEDFLFSFRQTGFWQGSEGLGTTSRVDLERLIRGPWLLRWTNSGTFSEESLGLRGYSAVTALRGFPGRKALAVEIGFNGELDAEVPLQDYGIKVAWRKSIARDWLVLELRTSLDYPREKIEQPRQPSWGVGIGFEMFFGTGMDDFLARPVTF